MKVYGYPYEVSVDQVLVDTMADAGFAPEHTGGGCMAWFKYTDDEDGYVMITYIDVELGKWDDRNDPEWMIGRYANEGEDWVVVSHATLERALKLAAGALRRPAAGEQETMSHQVWVETESWR